MLPHGDGQDVDLRSKYEPVKYLPNACVDVVIQGSIVFFFVTSMDLLGNLERLRCDQISWRLHRADRE